MTARRVLVISSDAAYAAAIRDVLAASLPGVASEVFHPADVRTRPVADAIVIDARADAAAGSEFAKKMRAMGFAGALAMVCDSNADIQLALTSAGAAAVAPAMLATELVTAIADQLELAKGDHAEQVMRARRLMAAGEAALGFQHALNNPLAGILAEAQLLQLDSLKPEQHAALERIVVLCKRIVELGRSLDGMGQRK